jgi:hypothetical protein
MKLKISFKSPDAVDYALDEYFEDDEDTNLEEIEDLKEKVKESLGKWIEYDEYVVVEFDTDKMTARVVPLKGD